MFSPKISREIQASKSKSTIHMSVVDEVVNLVDKVPEAGKMKLKTFCRSSRNIDKSVHGRFEGQAHKINAQPLNFLSKKNTFPTPSPTPPCTCRNTILPWIHGHCLYQM